MFEVSNELFKRVFVRYPQKSESLVFHTVNGLYIPFDPNWRNVAVSLSGGADSCSLALILCNIIKENNYDCKVHVVTFLRCLSTRPWQEPIAINVYEKLKSMFPNIIGERYAGYIPPELEHGVSGTLTSSGNSSGENKLLGNKSGDQIFGGSFYNYVAHRYGMDAVFNATSKNPKGVEFQTHWDRAPGREKDAEDGRLGDLIYTQNNERVWFITPYRFVQKSWIVAQYHLFDAMDLYHTTRSCEGDLDVPMIKEIFPDLYHYKWGDAIPECGVCFWCMERNWAEETCKEVVDKFK